MERNRSKCMSMAAFVFVLFSCQPASYIDKLTGGDVRYWQNCYFGNAYVSYLSFNKKDMKTAYYIKNYVIAPLNTYDAVNGTDFKVKGDTIITYWKKIPAVIDTIKIVKLTNRRLVLWYQRGMGPVHFKRHKGPNGPIKMHPYFGGEQSE